MPPRNRFTKEELIIAAVDAVRRNGCLTARAVAQRLGSSTKVIFGIFDGMDDLYRETVGAAYNLYLECVKESVNSGRYPDYKASGMAYIDFARRERELFKLLFMRENGGKGELSKLGDFDSYAGSMSQRLGISIESARLFHLEMWTYVHGIAVMLATGYLDLEQDIIDRMLTDAYLGISHRYVSGA